MLQTTNQQSIDMSDLYDWLGIPLLTSISVRENLYKKGIPCLNDLGLPGTPYDFGNLPIRYGWNMNEIIYGILWMVSSSHYNSIRKSEISPNRIYDLHILAQPNKCYLLMEWFWVNGKYQILINDDGTERHGYSKLYGCSARIKGTLVRCWGDVSNDINHVHPREFKVPRQSMMVYTYIKIEIDIPFISHWCPTDTDWFPLQLVKITLISHQYQNMTVRYWRDTNVTYARWKHQQPNTEYIDGYWC